MDWWRVLKNMPIGDEGHNGRKVQCPKCERYFYGEKGLNNHHCQKPMNFNAPLTLDENREMTQFLQQFMAPNEQSGDANCPACRGQGMTMEGDPCPICRGG